MTSNRNGCCRSTEFRTLWRGVADDLSALYREGDEMKWWSVSSATSSMETLQSPMYLGRAEKRTIFAIESKSGKPIRAHSHLQNDDEFLFLPGIRLRVMGSIRQPDGTHVIRVREIEWRRSQPIRTLAEVKSDLSTRECEVYRLSNGSNIAFCRRISQPTRRRADTINRRRRQCAARVHAVDRSRHEYCCRLGRRSQEVSRTFAVQQRDHRDRRCNLSSRPPGHDWSDVAHAARQSDLRCRYPISGRCVLKEIPRTHQSLCRRGGSDGRGVRVDRQHNTHVRTTAISHSQRQLYWRSRSSNAV